MTRGETGWSSAKRASFFFLVIAVLILIQTPVPVLLMSNLVSSEEALRLVGTLRSSTPGVLVALAVTYFYERSKDAAYSSRQEELVDRLTEAVAATVRQDDHARIARYLETTPPSQVVEAALVRVYDDVQHVDSLVDMLVPVSGPTRDLDLEVVLRDSDMDDRFAVDTTNRITVNDLPEVVLAFTSKTESGTRLWQLCPNLTQILIYESVDGAYLAASNATSDRNALQYVVHAGGRVGSLQRGSFEFVPSEEYGRYGIEDSDDLSERPVLVRAPILGGSGNRVTCIMKFTGTVARASRFSYHSMDRLSYVRRILFDWSGFNEESFRPHLIPFFMPRAPLPAIGATTRRVSIFVEQWLVPGAGVMLIW
jgi:hypothetical protein